MTPDPCSCKSLVESAATCNVCVAKLKETITRLNRRCQEAESAACVKVEEVQKAGPSLGRALAGWSAGNYRRKYEESIEVGKELINALIIATERALEKGSALVERGGTDVNRGQFLSLIHHALEKAAPVFGIPEILPRVMRKDEYE